MWNGKPDECANCVYQDQPGFNVGHMGSSPGKQPDGPVEIMFVGEALGEDEIDARYNFAGGAGRTLNKHLVDTGIVRDKCFITNVVRCHPPGNEAPRPSAIRQCRKFLVDELVRVRPNLIVTLGDTATSWFTGDVGRITFRRGSVLPTPFGKMMASIHPAALWRNPKVFIPLFRRDLASAWKESQYPEYRYKENFDWWPSVDSIREVCYESVRRKRVTLDIETSFGDGLVRIGLGWCDRAISIPMVRGGGDCSSYYTNSEEREIVDLVYELLRDDSVAKGTHNGVDYDNYQLTNAGFHVQGFQYDGIIMHHCLHPELEHKLAKVASVHSTVPYYKELAKGKGEMVRLNPDEVGRYNSLDVKAQDESISDMEIRLKGMGMWRHYIEMALPMQEVACTALRRRGIYTDMSILSNRAMSLDSEVRVLDHAIRDFTWPGFNPGTNSGDVPKLLHGIWNYPVLGWTEKTHKPKADEDTFLKVKEMVTDPCHSQVLDLMTRYRQRAKIASSWTDDFAPSMDGRLHPDWLAYRTRTDRLASYPNVQNLPTDDNGECRKIFTVQYPENVFFYCDGKQAELRWNAIRAQDEPLLTNFKEYDAICWEIEYEETHHNRSGELVRLKTAKRAADPHIRNACDMWQTAPDHITHEMRFRGKIYVFGIQYGGTPESVLSHGGRGLTRSTANLDQLKQMEKNWWAKHPALLQMREESKARTKATRLYKCDIMGCQRQFFDPIADAIRECWDHDPQHGIAHIINHAHVPFELWCQENLKTDKNTFGSWGPVLQIHDALISEVPEDRVPECRAVLQREWETPFEMHGKKWIIPADFKVARRFNELR